MAKQQAMRSSTSAPLLYDQRANPSPRAPPAPPPHHSHGHGAPTFRPSPSMSPRPPPSSACMEYITDAAVPVWAMMAMI